MTKKQTKNYLKKQKINKGKIKPKKHSDLYEITPDEAKKLLYDGQVVEVPLPLENGKTFRRYKLIDNVLCIVTKTGEKWSESAYKNIETLIKDKTNKFRIPTVLYKDKLKIRPFLKSIIDGEFAKAMVKTFRGKTRI